MTISSMICQGIALGKTSGTGGKMVSESNRWDHRIIFFVLQNENSFGKATQRIEELAEVNFKMLIIPS